MSTEPFYHYFAALLCSININVRVILYQEINWLVLSEFNNVRVMYKPWSCNLVLIS
jgi:uncharacterized sodium:solute symporter family permease YidK